MDRLPRSPRRGTALLEVGGEFPSSLGGKSPPDMGKPTCVPAEGWVGAGVVAPQLWGAAQTPQLATGRWHGLAGGPLLGQVGVPNAAVLLVQVWAALLTVGWAGLVAGPACKDVQVKAGQTLDTPATLPPAASGDVVMDTSTAGEQEQRCLAENWLPLTRGSATPAPASSP